jgi:hypothetical protein
MSFLTNRGGEAQRVERGQMDRWVDGEGGSARSFDTDGIIPITTVDRRRQCDLYLCNSQDTCLGCV